MRGTRLTQLILAGGMATALVGALAGPAAAATKTFTGSPPLHWAGTGSPQEISVSIQFRLNPAPLVVTTRVRGQLPRSMTVTANDHRRTELIRYLPDGQQFDVTVTGDSRPVVGTLRY